MKIGRSSKSGKIGYINKHHILGKKYRTTKEESKGIIKLSLDEHASIHRLTDSLNDKNSVFSVFMKWLFGNDKC